MLKMNGNAVVAKSWLTMEVPKGLAKAFGVTSFVALLALGAHVKFFLPGNPVPVTLQTFFVLLAGGLLGVSGAMAAIGAYVVLGMAGVPLFAGAGPMGLAYLAGPTGGYLLGFFLAGALIATVTRRTKSRRAWFVAFVTGSALILGVGILHLWLVFGMPLKTALILGAAPFVYGDAVKTAAAYILCIGLRERRAG